MNAREARQTALQASEDAKKAQYEKIKNKIDENSSKGYLYVDIYINDLYHNIFFPKVKENLEEEGFFVGNEKTRYVKISWEDELEENENVERIQKENDIKDLKRIIKRWGDGIYDLFAKINKNKK
jgi:hypothetical protein